MTHDPTAWVTPMHGWTYWLQRSCQEERLVYELAESYQATYGTPIEADIALIADPKYQVAVKNQQFAERRCNTFGLAVMIRMLEAQLAENRRLTSAINALTAAITHQPPPQPPPEGR
jgi:hypothetical protein